MVFASVKEAIRSSCTIISTAAVEIQNKRNCRHVRLKTTIKMIAFYEQQRTIQYRKFKTC